MTIPGATPGPLIGTPTTPPSGQHTSPCPVPTIRHGALREPDMSPPPLQQGFRHPTAVSRVAANTSIDKRRAIGIPLGPRPPDGTAGSPPRPSIACPDRLEG